jgi:hypothetical protein
MAQHSGHQADHGVDDHHRRHFAAVEHVVADRNLVRLKDVDHPLIEPFVPSAQQDQARLCSQFFDDVCVSRRPCGVSRTTCPG